MQKIACFTALFCIVTLCSCSDQTDPKSPDNDITDASTSSGNEKKKIHYDSPLPESVYQQLYKKIIHGQAKLFDVRQALTDKNPAALSNTVHALYSMKWHRGVNNILSDMWALDQRRYPELSWELIEKPPVRIALASTMNRIDQSINREYTNYIRQYKDDPHEFIKAQVVVALGFAGDPADVDYLKNMASGDNVYVTQSALTGLAFMNNPAARDALLDLGKMFKDDPRGVLIEELLDQAYDLQVQKNTTEQSTP